MARQLEGAVNANRVRLSQKLRPITGSPDVAHLLGRPRKLEYLHVGVRRLAAYASDAQVDLAARLDEARDPIDDPLLTTEVVVGVDADERVEKATWEGQVWRIGLDGDDVMSEVEGVEALSVLLGRVPGVKGVGGPGVEDAIARDESPVPQPRSQILASVPAGSLSRQSSSNMATTLGPMRFWEIKSLVNDYLDMDLSPKDH